MSYAETFIHYSKLLSILLNKIDSKDLQICITNQQEIAILTKPIDNYFNYL